MPTPARRPHRPATVLPLPSPASVKLSLASKDGGRKLVVTDGLAMIGPLQSTIGGEVRLPPAPASTQPITSGICADLVEPVPEWRGGTIVGKPLSGFDEGLLRNVLRICCAETKAIRVGVD